MVNETRYTSIRRVLDDLLEHPMLQGLDLEQAVRHTLRFISLHGYPALYSDRVADVEIRDFRGALPCDLVSVTQVVDALHKVALRAMTGTFPPGAEWRRPSLPPRCGCLDGTHNVRPGVTDREHVPPPPPCREAAFKTSICNNTPLKDINKEAMRIFLAGGISGNLREFYQRIMKTEPTSVDEIV